MTKDSKIPDMQELPQIGLLRVKQVLRFIPVSRSTWWQGIKEGRFPPGRKLSAHVTVWKASDIQALIEGVKL